MTTLSATNWRDCAERELALLREMHRRRCRASLETFCTEALAPLGQKPAAHHRLLIRHLEDVARGRCPRLMVNMPPGSAKSTFGSDLFPAWAMAQRPGLQIIGASNTATLAESFSRRVMGRVRQHGDLLGYGLSRENAELWSTTNGGQYRAAGVGGVITGIRADCVTADSLVQTVVGPRRIDMIEIGTETGYVLSYDEVAKACSYRRVVAIARRYSDIIWRIRTAAGRVVKVTGNHRFWTERGWIAAASLVDGDILLRAMPSANAQGSLRGSEEHRQPVLLREALLKGSNQRCAGPALSRMSDMLRPLEDARRAALFGCMSRDSQEGSPPTKDPGSAGVRVLQLDVCSEVDGRHGNLLRQDVCEPSACFSNARSEQPRMAQRDESFAPAASLGESLQTDQAGNLGARRASLCGVPIRRSPARPPYQHEPVGQSLVQPRCVVPQVPPSISCGGAFQAERDIVALVERVCESAEVFDIQVEGTECFFANDLLVHNCVIIDDPVKSRAEAESATVRETQWNWFTSDLRTRLKPDAAIVVIMTRWHPDDLGGRLLERQPGLWRVVSLPAIAGENDALGRAPGEWLWQDDGYGYGAELRKVHAEYEAAGAMRDWAALYQQQPRPATGSLFKTEAVSVLDAAPAGGAVVRAWDLAATKQTGTRDPDHTVGVKLARMPDGRFAVLDVVRLRGGPDEVEAAIVNTAAQDGRSVRVGLPKDPGQAGVQQVLYLTRKLAGHQVESSPETGDKATRAAPVAAQVNVGNLSLVRAPWNAAFLDELGAFPSGTKDDQVDALSRAFAMLANPVAPAHRTNVNFMAR